MTPVDPLCPFAAARDAPEGLCLVCPAEGVRETFGTMALRVAAAQTALRGAGVNPGDRVAVLASNRATTVVALWAVASCGATAVLVPPRLTPREAEALLRDALPRLSLDDAGLDVLLGGSPAGEVGPTADLDPETILAMVYTSGTTGRPKGALLSRRAFAASAAASAQRLGWRGDDRWVLCMPVCHVGGLSVLTRCLAARRPVVLLPRFDPEAVLGAIAGEGGTLVSVVPTMAQGLMEADRGEVLRALRVMLIGGAACPPALRAALAARGVSAVPTYGLTEACSQVATPSPDGAASALDVPGHVGRPLDGIRVQTVDPQGAPCPPEAVGRILVGGPTLLSGYWGDPPRREAWFDTGDLGALQPDGSLVVVGRGDDLIVTGGENVYPQEVEAALLGCPAVEGALVFGVEDPRWGHAVAAALVMARDPAGADEGPLGAVLAHLRGTLAGYKRPRYVAVVEALPTLPSGKPDRRGAGRLLAGRLRSWAG